MTRTLLAIGLLVCASLVALPRAAPFPQGLDSFAAGGRVPPGFSILGTVPNSPVGYHLDRRLDVGDTWRWRSPMPTPRSDLAAAVIEGRIFVVGGSDASQHDLDTLEGYDALRDEWYTLQSMPTPRQFLAGVACGGKLYAIGGMHNGDWPNRLATNEVYDPAADRWESRAQMPTPRVLHAAAEALGCIYVVGGVGSDDALATNERYDPATDSWTRCAPMTTPSSGCIAVTVNDRIHVLGGDYHVTLDSNQEYDPATDSWSVKAPMPHGRVLFAGAALDGRIYVMASIYGQTDAVDVYDPSNDRWTTMTTKSPITRSSSVAAAVLDSVYEIGGFAGIDPATNATTCYSPPGVYFVHTRN